MRRQLRRELWRQLRRELRRQLSGAPRPERRRFQKVMRARVYVAMMFSMVAVVIAVGVSDCLVVVFCIGDSVGVCVSVVVVAWTWDRHAVRQSSW